MPLNYKIKISNQLKLKKITNIPCSQENNRTEKRHESWTHGDLKLMDWVFNQKGRMTEREGGWGSAAAAKKEQSMDLR